MSREKEEELIKEIASKDKQIDTIKDQISVLKCQLLEEQTGFKVGDKVADYIGQKGILFLIENILVFGFGKNSRKMVLLLKQLHVLTEVHW